MNFDGCCGLTLTPNLQQQVSAEDEQRHLEHDQDGVDVDRLVKALLGNQPGVARPSAGTFRATTSPIPPTSLTISGTSMCASASWSGPPSCTA